MMSESKYFAKVVDGKVTNVVTVSDFSYIEQNPDRYGDASLYVETVFNDVAVRGAEAGDSYDAELGFIPPFIYPSWSWDVTKLAWVPPVPLPADAKTIDNLDGVHYNWDETNQEWV